MVTSEITIKADDGGQFMGYLSKPAHGSGPGVVVIQAIFGVNPVMRAGCDWLAGEGFVALCPDLFWRQEPGIQLTDSSEDRARAFRLLKGFDLDLGMRDIDATIGTLHKTTRCTGRVGSIGFCLGGLLAYLTATRTDVAAAVGYYGVNLDRYLDEALKCRVMLHIAGGDEYVPENVQKEIHKALDDNAMATLYDYPGHPHAFADTGGRHYHKESADLANRRTLEFLQANLT